MAGWTKFELPPNMIETELKSKKMGLSGDQVARIQLERLQSTIHNEEVVPPSQIDAWQKKIVEIEDKMQKESIAGEFNEDFYKWLTGRSAYNSTVRNLHVKGRDGVTTEIRQVPCCPWGNKPLTNLDGVCEFLDQGVDRRSEVITYIAKLKARGPRNLDEAYMYYKYIIRSLAIDQGTVREMDGLMHEYDYPRTVNEETGETETHGPGFDSAPPLFDQEAYQVTFDRFALAVQTRQQGYNIAQISSQEGFDLLSPMDQDFLFKQVTIDALKKYGLGNQQSSLSQPAQPVLQGRQDSQATVTDETKQLKKELKQGGGKKREAIQLVDKTAPLTVKQEQVLVPVVEKLFEVPLEKKLGPEATQNLQNLYGRFIQVALESGSTEIVEEAIQLMEGKELDTLKQTVQNKAPDSVNAKQTLRDVVSAANNLVNDGIDPSLVASFSGALDKRISENLDTVDIQDEIQKIMADKSTPEKVKPMLKALDVTASVQNEKLKLVREAESRIQSLKDDLVNAERMMGETEQAHEERVKNISSTLSQESKSKLSELADQEERKLHRIRDRLIDAESLQKSYEGMTLEDTMYSLKQEQINLQSAVRAFKSVPKERHYDSINKAAFNIAALEGHSRKLTETALKEAEMALAAEKREKDEQVAAVVGSLESLKFKHIAKNRELEEHVAERQRLSDELLQSQTALDQQRLLVSRSSGMVEHAKEVQRDLDAATKKSNELALQLQDKTHEIRALQDDLRFSESQKDKADEKISKITGKMGALETKIGTLKEENMEDKIIKKDAMKKLESKGKKLAAAKEKSALLAEERDKRDKAIQELEFAQKERDSSLKQHQEKINELNFRLSQHEKTAEENAELKRKLSEAETKVATTEAVTKLKEQQIDEARSELGEMKTLRRHKEDLMLKLRETEFDRDKFKEVASTQQTSFKTALSTTESSTENALNFESFVAGGPMVVNPKSGLFNVKYAAAPPLAGSAFDKAYTSMQAANKFKSSELLDISMDPQKTRKTLVETNKQIQQEFEEIIASGKTEFEEAAQFMEGEYVDAEKIETNSPFTPYRDVTERDLSVFEKFSLISYNAIQKLPDLSKGEKDGAFAASIRHLAGQAIRLEAENGKPVSAMDYYTAPDKVSPLTEAGKARAEQMREMFRTDENFAYTLFEEARDKDRLFHTPHNIVRHPSMEASVITDAHGLAFHAAEDMAKLMGNSIARNPEAVQRFAPDLLDPADVRLKVYETMKNELWTKGSDLSEKDVQTFADHTRFVSGINNMDVANSLSYGLQKFLAQSFQQDQQNPAAWFSRETQPEKVIESANDKLGSIPPMTKAKQEKVDLVAKTLANAVPYLQQEVKEVVARQADLSSQLGESDLMRDVRMHVNLSKTYTGQLFTQHMFKNRNVADVSSISRTKEVFAIMKKFSNQQPQ